MVGRLAETVAVRSLEKRWLSGIIVIFQVGQSAFPSTTCYCFLEVVTGRSLAVMVQVGAFVLSSLAGTCP